DGAQYASARPVGLWYRIGLGSSWADRPVSRLNRTVDWANGHYRALYWAWGSSGHVRQRSRYLECLLVRCGHHTSAQHRLACLRTAAGCGRRAHYRPVWSPRLGMARTSATDGPPRAVYRV